MATQNRLIKAREDSGRDIWINPRYLGAAQEYPGTRIKLYTMSGAGIHFVRGTVAAFLAAVGPYWDYFLVTMEGGAALAVSRDWISEMDAWTGTTRILAEFYGWTGVQETAQQVEDLYNGV